MELRGLEPLTPSLRTRGMAVVQAYLSTDLCDRRQGSPVEDDGVAVLCCCISRRCGFGGKLGGRGDAPCPAAHLRTDNVPPTRPPRTSCSRRQDTGPRDRAPGCPLPAATPRRRAAGLGARVAGASVPANAECGPPHPARPGRPQRVLSWRSGRLVCSSRPRAHQQSLKCSGRARGVFFSSPPCRRPRR